MSRVITLATLKQAGACATQRELFNELFPNGSPSTKRAALAAARRYADQFDWDWAARTLLSTSAQQTYESAHTPARQAYESARTSAFVNAWFTE